VLLLLLVVVVDDIGYLHILEPLPCEASYVHTSRSVSCTPRICTSQLPSRQVIIWCDESLVDPLDGIVAAQNTTAR
jgi:hypothetical protein